MNIFISGSCHKCGRRLTSLATYDLFLFGRVECVCRSCYKEAKR